MIDPRLPYSEQLQRRAEDLASATVHLRDTPDNGPLDEPIVMSSAFAFASGEQAARAFRGEEDAWIYGRWANPTTAALDARLAALEGATAACSTASGMAAIAGVILGLCQAGDHVVAPRSMYAESARLLRERLPRLGIRTTFVEGTPQAYADAVTPETRIVYLETPSNPTLGIVDVSAIANQVRALGERRPWIVVDGTFATPFAQSALALGADVVVHSLTKGLNGHGDVIGGAVVGDGELVDRARDFVVKGIGAVLAPMSAWLVLRGLASFPIRQAQANRTAATLARALASHPEIAAVHHPSLPDHPGHALACAQMHAFGTVLAFELAGDDAVARGRRVLEALKVATHAVSLGDVRTLATHPASTTHATMPAETRRLAGIGDGLVRVSVGLESAKDLVTDFERALARA